MAASRPVAAAVLAGTLLAGAPLLAGCGSQPADATVRTGPGPGSRDGAAVRTGRRPGLQDGAAVRALVREARPIGLGPRFHEPVRARVTECRRGLGPRFAVHVELFARNRVVLVPPGIGVAGPMRRSDGAIVAARCFGPIVTLDPTGVVLVRPGAPRTLGGLFRAWGEPLSANRLAAFSAPPGRPVRVFVDGRRRPGPARSLRLTARAEVVLEVGPEVPPHHRYVFGPLPG